MKRILRIVFDLAVPVVFGVAMGNAYGLGWGVAAIFGVAGYGVWCFFDGITV